MFSPPNDVNIIPEGHIPQSMLVMSGQCLIPHKGYRNESDDEFAYDTQQQKEDANFTIDTQCDCRGQALTFSFHVESAEEVRCYLSWQVQSVRFYPQDIIDVLPVIFDARYSKKNREFADSVDAKRMVNGVLIRDKYFEHFYRHLMAKKVSEFPSQKYKDFPWIGAKQLVVGYVRRSIDIDVIFDLVISYFCSFRFAVYFFDAFVCK